MSGRLQPALSSLLALAFAALSFGAFVALERPSGVSLKPRVPAIDFHTHLEPEVLDAALSFLDLAGIERAVNLAGVPSGPSLQAYVDMGARSGGRIITFAGVDWQQILRPGFGPRMADDLQRAVEQGARGLKIPKALGLSIPTPESLAVLPDGTRPPRQLLAIDDPRLDPVFERAGELGVPVAIHVADPVAFWQPIDKDNERFAELSLNPDWSYFGKPAPSHAELLAQAARRYARHPKTTFVAVHVAGFPEDLDAVARLLDDNPNVFVDVAARVPELGRHPREKARAFLVRYADRVLFGTDFGVGPSGVMLGAPLAWRETKRDLVHFFASTWRFFQTDDEDFAHPTPIQGEWTIDGVDLDDETLRKIYRDNAKRLLGLR
jgi:predicted TIM-barrel fold metal-dependent hydrolase